MTKEEKQLLFQDLCARLPYKAYIEIVDEDSNVHDEVELEPQHINTVRYDESISIRPYLRPISSMTEEEKKEFTKVLVKSQDCSYENNESSTTIVNDWYLSKGFDVRGLIPKGLALEAKEGMYK